MDGSQSAKLFWHSSIRAVVAGRNTCSSLRSLTKMQTVFRCTEPRLETGEDEFHLLHSLSTCLFQPQERPIALVQKQQSQASTENLNKRFPLVLVINRHCSWRTYPRQHCHPPCADLPPNVFKITSSTQLGICAEQMGEKRARADDH